MRRTRFAAIVLSVVMMAAACGSSDEPTALEKFAGGYPPVNAIEANFLADFDSAELDVLDSTIHYVSSGEPADHVVVLLHGQPTSSFLWRDVLPHLADDGYVVAPDLIGMGRSGQPAIDYSLQNHVDYFDAFIDGLAVDSVVLVMHDVGGLTGLSWAAQNPGRVAGLVMLETAFAPVADASQVVVPEFAELLPIARNPATTNDEIHQMFVEELLQSATATQLSEEVLDVYRASWQAPRDRRSLAAWPRELPIGGEPAGSHALMSAAFGWLTSAEVPKVLFFGEPGYLMPGPVVDLAAATIPGLETASVGLGVHYLQEDVPDGLGELLSNWLQANDLA